MKSPHSDIVAALDIGGAKSVCLIAERQDEKMRILGAAQQRTQGIGSGGIVSVREAESMLRNVVSTAEKMAGVNINDVVLSISHCRQRAAVTAIQQDVHNVITEGAMLRMIEKGCRRFAEDGRGILHAIPVEYAIDGATGITDPSGMQAEQVAAKVHLIDTDMTALTPMVKCLAHCHLDLRDVVSAPYASCLSVLTECEQEFGVLVVELGGASSSVSLFKRKRLVYMDTIPLGGAHITNDIAIGLCTSSKHAERLKSLYGSVMPSYNDENETIEFVHREDIAAGREDTAYASRAHLVTMIGARMEEIIDMLFRRMPEGMLDQAPSGIVITGGGSALGGMREYLTQRTGATVRIGKPKPIRALPDAMSGAAFAAVTGALHYPAYKQTMLGVHLKDFYARKGPVRRLKEWMMDNV